MSAVVVLSLASHLFRRAWAIKSGPFSNRMTIDAGSMLVSSSSTTTASLALQRLPTPMARKKLLDSSMRMINARPGR